MEDDCQEVDFKNQIFDKDEDKQVVVAENQVVIEFVPKIECCLLMVNVAPEFVPKQECKLQVVTIEDHLNSEYVNLFWETVERQQEAYKQVREVANQIESSIPITAVISV